MGFKEGDYVRIVKNLGELAGHPKNRYYYYDGALRDVKLGQKGVIEELAEQEKIRIRLDNGENWNVHPKEIEKDATFVLEKIEKEMPKFTSELNHPLFELSDKTNVYLVDGTVYTTSKEKKKKPTDCIKEKKLIFFHKVTALEIAAELLTLDDLANSRIEDEMPALSEVYLKTIVKENERIQNIMNGNLDTPQMIFKHVFPYLKDEGIEDKIKKELGLSEKKKKQTTSKKKDSPEKYNENLEGYVGSVKKEINGIINGLIEEIDESDDLLSKRIGDLLKSKKYQKDENRDKPLESPSLSKIIGAMNVAIINGAVYSLKESKSKDSREIVISGKKYWIGEKIESLTNIKARYFEKLGQKIKIDTLQRKFSDKEIESFIKDQDFSIRSIAKKESMDEGGYGFVKDGNDYYAYLEVPELIIKSHYDGKYYHFDKSRVAIYVKGREGRFDIGEEIVLIDNNNHPFLHLASRQFAKICTGYEHLPTQATTGGELIAEKLKTGKEILMYGYIGTDYSYCYKLLEKCPSCGHGHYSNNLITEKKALEMNIPIIDGGKRR